MSAGRFPEGEFEGSLETSSLQRFGGFHGRGSGEQKVSHVSYVFCQPISSGYCSFDVFVPQSAPVTSNPRGEEG